MGVQVRTFCFQIPEVWFRQASGNSLLHQMPEQLGHFQRVSCIGRIKPGLEQGAVFIEKHLPVSAYGFAVFPRNVGIYGIKYHADSIVHIGKTTRLVSSVAKAMAGHPCVGFAGHLQKVTGMYGENSDLLHGQRVQSVGKLCKNGVVPGVPIDAVFLAKFSDNAAGLLIFGTAYPAALS